MMLKHYRSSIVFTVIAVALGFWIGGPATAFLVLMLGVLETSLSFDNAVVNARVLNGWDEVWRRRFIVWGIPIAVFGMRVVFPILIVCVTLSMSPWAVTVMALDRPAEYAANLSAVHHQVAGFGGAFLMMVGLTFFFEEKDIYWFKFVEDKLTKFGQIESIVAATTLVTLLVLSGLYDDARHGEQFLVAGLVGVIAYIITHGLGTVLGAEEDDTGSTIVKAGVAGFLYLEVLDASFSFDGVIGAFALTNYLPIIALGLGVGAFFVRSMTLHLVEAGTLAEYRYLEHGAFYAILALATLMFASGLGLHLPEWITGLLGGAIIAGSVWHSHVLNKKENAS